MTRRERAINNFKKGYNCSQAIVLAFDDVLTIDPNELIKIASPFGGGISRMREICGAASGMVLVLGNIIGYDTPEIGEKKHELYKNTQELLRIFENKYGSLTCRVFLNLTNNHDDPLPSKRDQNFFTKRPCLELIGGAAEILENFLKEKGILQ